MYWTYAMAVAAVVGVAGCAGLPGEGHAGHKTRAVAPATEPPSVPVWVGERPVYRHPLAAGSTVRSALLAAGVARVEGQELTPALPRGAVAGQTFIRLIRQSDGEAVRHTFPYALGFDGPLATLPLTAGDSIQVSTLDASGLPLMPQEEDVAPISFSFSRPGVRPVQHTVSPDDNRFKTLGIGSLFDKDSVFGPLNDPESDELIVVSREGGVAIGNGRVMLNSGAVVRRRGEVTASRELIYLPCRPEYVMARTSLRHDPREPGTFYDRVKFVRQAVLDGDEITVCLLEEVPEVIGGHLRGVAATLATVRERPPAFQRLRGLLPGLAPAQEAAAGLRASVEARRAVKAEQREDNR